MTSLFRLDPGLFRDGIPFLLILPHELAERVGTARDRLTALLRNAIAANTPAMIDLTPALKRKVGL